MNGREGVVISVLLALIASWKGAKVLLESDRAASPKTAVCCRVSEKCECALGNVGFVGTRVECKKEL